MSDGRNRVAELEAEADWRKSETAALMSANIRLAKALERIMAEVALLDDDREPDCDLIFDTARAALEGRDDE